MGALDVTRKVSFSIWWSGFQKTLGPRKGVEFAAAVASSLAILLFVVCHNSEKWPAE